MLWLLYHHILFAFGDCAASLCFAGTANCLCYLWWIVKDVKPTQYAFPSNLYCSLLWQNRAEKERFQPQLEVSKGLWIMCDGVEDNEGCWNVSETCCRICQDATALKTFHIVIVYFSRLKCQWVCVSECILNWHYLRMPVCFMVCAVSMVSLFLYCLRSSANDGAV